MTVKKIVDRNTPGRVDQVRNDIDAFLVEGRFTTPVAANLRGRLELAEPQSLAEPYPCI